MPESTSSNTIVGTASRPSAATSIASEMRDSSPPEATLRSGRGGWPGLAATRNSTRSPPCGSGRSASMGSSATSKRPPPMPSSAISAVVAATASFGGLRDAPAPSTSAAWRQCARAASISASSALQALAGAAQRVQFGGNRIALRGQLFRRRRGACAPVRGGGRAGARCRRRRTGRGPGRLRTRSSRAEALRRSGWRRCRAWRRRRRGAVRARPRAAARCAPAAGCATATGLRRRRGGRRRCRRRRSGRRRGHGGGGRPDRSAMASGSSVSRSQFGELVFEPVDAVGDVALRRAARRARAAARSSVRAAASHRRASSRLVCGRTRRAGRAGWAWTSGPGARAGHGFRPAARPVRPVAPSVAGRPLIQALEPPSARMTRRIWQAVVASSSSSLFAQPGRARRARRRGRTRRPVRRGRRRGGPRRCRRAARTASPGHRPAATCRRRFRRKSRSGRDRNPSSAARTTAKSLMARWASMGRDCAL